MKSLTEQVEDTVGKYEMFSAGDKILIAVSGGPDSMALLNVLLNIRKKHGIELVVAHLDHGFRSDSGADAEFVRCFADQAALPAMIKRIDIPSMMKELRLSAQEAARNIRYKFLSEAAHEMKATKIAMGHTDDDQAETVLMRLLRGAGLRGLGGIPPVRGQFIRPLIESSRRDIETHITENSISYVVDSSNFKTDYLRNRIRLELLPFLETYNPNIKDVLLRTARSAARDHTFMEIETEKVYERISAKGDHVMMPAEDLKALHPAIRSRVLVKAILSIKGDLKGISSRHIEDIMRLLDSGSGRWVVHLPSVTVTMSIKHVCFMKGLGRR